MGISGARFKGQVRGGERKQVVPIGTDEEDRSPAGDRYKESNVTWPSRCGELKRKC